jgi:hypothetical protein
MNPMNPIMSINQVQLNDLQNHLHDHIQVSDLSTIKKLFSKLFDFHNEVLENLFLTSILNLDEMYEVGTGDNTQFLGKDAINDIVDKYENGLMIGEENFSMDDIQDILNNPDVVKVIQSKRREKKRKEKS